MNNNSRYFKDHVEEIRDAYIDLGDDSKAEHLTKQFTLPDRVEQADLPDKIPKTMSQLWDEEMHQVIEFIESETRPFLQKIYQYAANGHVDNVKEGISPALATLDGDWEEVMTKYYFLYHVGALFLQRGYDQDACDVLDKAAIWALKPGDCEGISRVSDIAQLFCMKKMFNDVERIMERVSEDEICTWQPYKARLVPLLIATGKLESACEFAIRINTQSCRDNTLDDLVTVYAERGDVKNMLALKKYFLDQETMRWTYSFALVSLADFIVETDGEYLLGEIESLEGLAK